LLPKFQCPSSIDLEINKRRARKETIVKFRRKMSKMYFLVTGIRLQRAGDKAILSEKL
jgi:hypothetical protein